jgi:PIN domain nuclease of toxin-antitoxin system
MSLVLDSSATLAFIYSDETTESILRVFDAVANEGAVVPGTLAARGPPTV